MWDTNYCQWVHFTWDYLECPRYHRILSIVGWVGSLHFGLYTWDVLQYHNVLVWILKMSQATGVCHVHLGMSKYLLGLVFVVLDISHIMQITVNTESTYMAIEFSLTTPDIPFINYKYLCIHAYEGSVLSL